MKAVRATLMALMIGAVGCGDEDDTSADAGAHDGHDHDGGEHDDHDGGEHDDHDGGEEHDDHDGGEEHEMKSFSLQFGAIAGDEAVGCEDTVEGAGPDGEHSVGVSDLRFYVSNLTFLDSEGEEVELELDEDDFQYHHEDGIVSLVDLTGNEDGYCAPDYSASSEATQRVHSALTGMTYLDDVASIAFDVGVPQAVMKDVIGNNTLEGAPSPLGEMHWSWAGGYRHFVANLTVELDGEMGDGALHIGSRDCGEGSVVLENQDACNLLNTPKVAFDSFDLESDVVNVDILKLVEDMDFIADDYQQNAETGEWEVVGQILGLGCHSSPSAPHCTPMFEHFGLSLDDGSADASENDVFVKN